MIIKEREVEIERWREKDMEERGEEMKVWRN